jgi:hypothetical protein
VVVDEETTVTSLSARAKEAQPRAARRAIRKMRTASIMLLNLSAFSLVRVCHFSSLGESPLFRHGNQVDYSINHPKTCEKIL